MMNRRRESPFEVARREATMQAARRHARLHTDQRQRIDIFEIVQREIGRASCRERV